ncbi:MAG: CDP-alcohol phosphatidyltransferase family protein [Roseiflexaceae bacterium]|nr:CDP-alcohol phosphatidyltransferase family protein [Roseiflexaceae bacterium]
MFDRVLRVPKERLLIPLATGPLRNLDPTLVTVAAALIGVAAAAAAWQQQAAAAVFLWALNRLLDGLDGTLARHNNRQSDLGGYLDIVLDTLIYAIVPIGLALGVHTVGGYLALALLLASFYINASSWMYLAALLEKRSQGAQANGELTTITMPGGLIEGAETIVFFTLFLLLPSWLVPLFSLMALLVIVTTCQRIVWAIKHL